MIIRLSEDFRTISDQDLREHYATIERLLIAHLERRHIFVPPQVIISRIEEIGGLGIQASAALGKIRNSYQDYQAISRLVSHKIIVLPRGGVIPLRINMGDYHIRTQDVNYFLENSPSLYVENAAKDGNFYEFIAEEVCSILGLPKAYMRIEKINGGGSTLAAVMYLHGANLRGLCICDRDTAKEVPPFGGGTTGEACLRALIALSVVQVTGTELLPLRPDFKFLVTRGWGLENYVGPKLLDLFYSNNPPANASRRNFLRVFPNFPDLSTDELLEWWMINLKEAQNVDTVIAGYEYRRAGVEVEDPHYAGLAGLSYPGNVIDWVLQNARDSRFASSIVAAFRDDLTNLEYKSAIMELALPMISIFAADRNFRYI